MKSLFPAQAKAASYFSTLLHQGRNTLDASQTGTGKTVVAGHLARGWANETVVICPKSVIPSWQRELAECGVEPLFVLNPETLRNGRTQWMSKVGKKVMSWHLPEGTLVLCDEVHRLGGGDPFSQNGQLLISLVQQGYRVHLMSATAAEDPTECRALGYALGLHNLNKSTDQLPSWFRWMQAHGCSQNQWGAWEFRNRRKLLPIHEALFGMGGPARRLTIEDFPDSFRQNRVFVEPIQFEALEKIHAAYQELGITPAIVEEYLETGTIKGSPHLLVNILRARQLAEMLKIPDMVEMTKDLLYQNYSVVLFVNFRETVATLSAALGGCPVIEGGQRADYRQNVVDDFRSDSIFCSIVNIAAGGTGVSLHDLNGNRPRVSLISPTFDAKAHQQALGRIHRNGAKSDALQKILVAAGTVEETVMAAIDRKLANMEALHGGLP